jgi:hypothetical protein
MLCIFKWYICEHKYTNMGLQNYRSGLLRGYAMHCLFLDACAILNFEVPL